MQDAPVIDPAAPDSDHSPDPAPETLILQPADPDPISLTAPDGSVDVAGFLQDLWNLKLFKLGSTEVDVSQIIIALIVLVVGALLAKVIANRVGQRVLPRLKVNRGAASALQAILYYTLLAIAVLLSMQVAGVPLTVFTLFGGIVALGVGFGSQNIVSNFISGLIILIERPISVGDLVVVSDRMGTVQRVGARATHIEDYLGTTVIVPNSYILENKVSNLSLPTPVVRSSVTVGVAYGSDVNKVTELLELSVNEHERVIKQRQSAVLFSDFADSALVFEAHFWIKPKNTLDKLTIESEIRYTIDRLFREHDISIPFPQRDTNLKADKPIEVRVRND
ncbi:MAG: mechanosensitive ion channel family protein [Phycisphaerales bacterium]